MMEEVMAKINQKTVGGKEKDAKCEEHYCREEVGVIERFEEKKLQRLKPEQSFRVGKQGKH